MGRTIGIITLGCKVNQYDSEAMTEILERRGYTCVPFHQKADAYLINTCTVTGTADKKSRQMIARARRENPQAVIGAAGCLAQRGTAIEGVDFVIGTQDRAKIADVLDQAFEGKKLNLIREIAHEKEFEELTVSTSGEKTRGHLKICEGCNNFCSYCIIPYTRGPVRSRKLENIVEETKRLTKNGVKEVVLTGIHLASYGIDREEKLIDVIRAVNKVEGIERIRLGSMEPLALTEEFCKQAAECKKLCAHFHISMQSGSDRVLKRMRRRYTSAQFYDVVENVRRFFEEPAITTDIIAGFPGETEEEHSQTKTFIQKVGFSRIHVFPYSEREGTRAASMPGVVPVHERKRRAGELIEIGKRMEQAFAQRFIGREQKVLIEQREGEWMEGYTERYLLVRKPSGKEGQIERAKIVGCADGILYGE